MRTIIYVWQKCKSSAQSYKFSRKIEKVLHKYISAAQKIKVRDKWEQFNKFGTNLKVLHVSLEQIYKFGTNLKVVHNDISLPQISKLCERIYKFGTNVKVVHSDISLAQISKLCEQIYKFGTNVKVVHNDISLPL